MKPRSPNYRPRSKKRRMDAASHKRGAKALDSRPWQDRLREKIAVVEGDACWEWTGRRKSDGYGMFSIEWGRPARAHRLAYELAHGPIPPGQWVLHHCDNRGCCNPAHLYLGTVVENVRDMIARGRAKHARRLKPDQIREVRKLAAGGMPAAAIAAACGLCERTISRALSGKTWTKLT